MENLTGGPVTVVFPPGLVIVAASEGYQNGLLLERAVVTIPPIETGPGGLLNGEKRRVVYVPLHVYCVNPDKSPSDSTATFELGPVSQHGGMAELYRLLEGRDIANDRDPVEAVQEAVYDIVRLGEISEGSWESLREYVLGPTS